MPCGLLLLPEDVLVSIVKRCLGQMPMRKAHDAKIFAEMIRVCRGLRMLGHHEELWKHLVQQIWPNLTGIIVTDWKQTFYEEANIERNWMNGQFALKLLKCGMEEEKEEEEEQNDDGLMDFSSLLRKHLGNTNETALHEESAIELCGDNLVFFKRNHMEIWDLKTATLKSKRALDDESGILNTVSGLDGAWQKCVLLTESGKLSLINAATGELENSLILEDFEAESTRDSGMDLILDMNSSICIVEENLDHVAVIDVNTWNIIHRIKQDDESINQITLRIAGDYVISNTEKLILDEDGLATGSHSLELLKKVRDAENKGTRMEKIFIWTEEYEAFTITSVGDQVIVFLGNEEYIVAYDCATMTEMWRYNDASLNDIGFEGEKSLTLDCWLGGTTPILFVSFCDDHLGRLDRIIDATTGLPIPSFSGDNVGVCYSQDCIHGAILWLPVAKGFKSSKKWIPSLTTEEDITCTGMGIWRDDMNDVRCIDVMELDNSCVAINHKYIAFGTASSHFVKIYDFSANFEEWKTTMTALSPSWFQSQATRSLPEELAALHDAESIGAIPGTSKHMLLGAACVYFFGSMGLISGATGDNDKGIECLKRSAQLGHAYSTFVLACCRFSGVWADVNIPSAVKYVELAASQGHSLAKRICEVLKQQKLEDAEKLEIWRCEVKRWFEDAAESGNAPGTTEKEVLGDLVDMGSMKFAEDNLECVMFPELLGNIQRDEDYHSNYSEE